MMAKNGLHLITPTSIAYTGTSATISANGSVSFSAVSELRLNGVFDSSYDNYAVVINAIKNGSSATNRAVVLDFPPYSSSTFTVQYLAANGTSVSGSRSSVSAFTVARITDNGLYSGAINYLYGPYLAQPTAHREIDASVASGASIWDRAGTESSSTQHENMRLICSPDNMSGLVAVYGMRK